METPHRAALAVEIAIPVAKATFAKRLLFYPSG
jgi:hypothetical protein